MRALVYLSLTLLCTLMGCTKEPAAEPLPLDQFTVMEAVSVRTVQDPYSGGIIVLCKRAIDDPVLAKALFFGANGDLESTLEFAGLTNTVENITFGTEAWSITDLVPLPNNAYLLIGVGIQTEIDDRIHVLVHRVDRSGNTLAQPVRRFVADKGTLVRANDMDELYRTRALGAMRDPDRLIVTVRYDRAEGPLPTAYHRTYQIALSAGVGSSAGLPVQLVTADHLIHGLLADGSGGTLLFMDTENTSGPGKDVLVTHSMWTDEAEQTVATPFGLRDAVPTSFLMHDGVLALAGYYQVDADVRRPFFAASSDLDNVQNAISYPQLAGTDRTALISAISPANGGYNATSNVYDQPVLSIRALRDDRFCDLTTAQLAADGSVVSTKVVIAGKGLRALGSWGEGNWLVGAFHPYLNTDYLHTFVLRTTN